MSAYTVISVDNSGKSGKNPQNAQRSLKSKLETGTNKLKRQHLGALAKTLDDMRQKR